PALAGFLLLVTCVIPFMLVPKGIQPEGNPNFLAINIEAAPGSTVEDMRTVVGQLDTLLTRQPETQAVFSTVGAGGGAFTGGGFASSAGVTKGQVTMILKDKRKARVGEIRDRLRPHL